MLKNNRKYNGHPCKVLKFLFNIYKNMKVNPVASLHLYLVMLKAASSRCGASRSKHHVFNVTLHRVVMMTQQPFIP